MSQNQNPSESKIPNVLKKYPMSKYLRTKGTKTNLKFICSYVIPVVLIMILLSRTSYHLRRHERAQSALHREEHREGLEPLNTVENPNAHHFTK